MLGHGPYGNRDGSLDTEYKAPGRVSGMKVSTQVRSRAGATEDEQRPVGRNDDHGQNSPHRVALFAAPLALARHPIVVSVHFNTRTVVQEKRRFGT